MEIYKNREAFVTAARCAYQKILEDKTVREKIQRLNVSFGLIIEDLNIEWNIVCKNSNITWEEGRGDDQDFTFIFKDGKSFYDAFTEKRNPLYFILTRKLKFSGDILLSKKLAEFARPLQKAFIESCESIGGSEN